MSKSHFLKVVGSRYNRSERQVPGQPDGFIENTFKVSPDPKSEDAWNAAQLKNGCEISRQALCVSENPYILCDMGRYGRRYTWEEGRPEWFVDITKEYTKEVGKDEAEKNIKHALKNWELSRKYLITSKRERIKELEEKLEKQKEYTEKTINALSADIDGLEGH